MLGKNLLEIVYPYADKPAIVCDNITLSYQQLWAAIVDFRDKLKELGLNQGDPSLVLLPNCPQFVIAFYAVVLLKGIAVPLDPTLEEEEIEEYLRDSQASLVITDTKRANIARNVIIKLDKNIELVIVDNNWRNWRKEKDFTSERISFYAGDVIYQYVASSSGKPNRIQRTQYNLYHEIKNFTGTIEITKKDKILALVPFYHSHGLVNCLLAALSNGATLVILEQEKKQDTKAEIAFDFSHQRALELIKKEQITILMGSPYLFQNLVEFSSNIARDLSSIRLCLCASKALEKKLFKQFLEQFKIPLRQFYCFAESGVAAVNLASDIELNYNSVGKPIKNVQIKIIDEQGNSLEPGNIGGIMIRSATLTTGYDNQPELSQISFQNGGFLTGDLGKKDPAGNLFVTGRK